MPKRGMYLILMIALVVALGNHIAVSYAGQEPIVGPGKYDRLKDVYQKKMLGSIERYGYYAEDWATDRGSLTSVQNFGQHMTAVVPFNYQVDSQGNLKGDIPDRVLQVARQKKLQVYGLVHNYNQNGFDRALISNVLNGESHRKRLVDNIYKVVKEKDLAGVNIDLENIKGSDRKPFNLFLTELKEKLARDGYLLTISVPAKTWDDPSNAWSGGFDYKHIGSVADRVMLMTYDEHWFGGSPGPVASLPWVDKVVKYATTQIPKDKLVLGIGAYGYDWSASGKTKVVTTNKANALASGYGAKVMWDSNAQVPYFNYWVNSQKHEVWFENPQSAALKANLVKKHGIRGIAVWRLGFEDKAFWDSISKTLAK